LEPLHQKLQHLPTARVAVLGVGHELSGDDAAGLAIARALIPRATGQARLFIVEAGPAPENQTGALRAFKPDLVIMVDAAQMNAEPGTIRWLAWEDTTGISASTHTLPLHMLARFMIAEFGCEVALIGIQPFDNLFSENLSPNMQQAVDEVVQGLADTLLTG
jgi:hydrogenase 3 maturation protease